MFRKVVGCHPNGVGSDRGVVVACTAAKDGQGIKVFRAAAG